MNTDTSKKTFLLVEGALMIAMAFVLSYIKLYDMPMGGSITLEMIPLVIMGLRHGVKWGTFTAAVHGIIQLILGFSNVMYCATIPAMIGCVLLDYLFAFTVLGLAWQYMKNRGGVEVRCDSTYPVNEKLKAYRQDDDRWKDDKLGESKFDMESSGCIITSIATAISASDNALAPGELNQLLSDNQVYDGEGNLQWGLLDAINGFHTKVYSDVSAAHIDECLKENHYPIVKVHRQTLTSYHHFILIVGTKDGEYICMDPLEDKLTKLSDYGSKVYAVRCVWYEKE